MNQDQVPLVVQQLHSKAAIHSDIFFFALLVSLSIIHPLSSTATNQPLIPQFIPITRACSLSLSCFFFSLGMRAVIV